jgi:hypothetical protein
MMAEVTECMKLVMTQLLMTDQKFSIVDAMLYITPAGFFWLQLGSYMCVVPLSPLILFVDLMVEIHDGCEWKGRCGLSSVFDFCFFACLFLVLVCPRTFFLITLFVFLARFFVITLFVFLARFFTLMLFVFLTCFF